MKFIIEIFVDGAWQELLGHCCHTVEEANAYVSGLFNNSPDIRVRVL